MIMNLKFEKRFLSLAAITLGLFVISVVYSCTSDEYADTGEEAFFARKMTVRTLAAVDKKEHLLIAVAESDEFVDFLISAKQLAEKVDAYKATLDKNELNKCGVEDVINKMNIENELILLKESRSRLHSNTSFLELDDIQRFQLFSDFTRDERSLLKKKEEGEKKDECERKRKKGYDDAQTLFEICVSCCPAEDFVKCVKAALKIRDNARDKADYDYMICMGEIK